MNTDQAKQPPDVPALLAELENFLTRYAVLPSGMPLALALHAVMSHCFGVFDALAYIAITSPTKGCGKTRVLELLSFVCFRPVSTVGISPAALFRTIQDKSPTLLVDESESLSVRTEKAQALREIANAGYKRGQRVQRCEPKKGGKYEVKEFEVFGPKVFALIGRLPATLADRSIAVRMQRTRKRLARYRRARVEPEGRVLHDQIAGWVSAHKDEIKEWYLGNDLEFLEGRNEELWLPLFAVCAVMAPERLSELKAIARQCVGATQDDDSDEINLRLLSDIRDIFSGKQQADMPSVNLCKVLNGNVDLPYKTWNSGLGIQPTDLGRRLRPFGIHPRNLRIGGQVLKGYARQGFEPAWESYLPPVPASDSRYTATTRENSGQDANSSAATKPPVADTQSAVSPSIDAPCSAVAAPEASTPPHTGKPSGMLLPDDCHDPSLTPEGDWNAPERPGMDDGPPF